ncbi:hypothetical protein D3C76_1401270 [compost metagenome]
MQGDRGLRRQYEQPGQFIFPAGGLRRRYRDNLVALALRQLWQIGDREHQHTASGADRQQHIVAAVDFHRRQCLGVVRQGDHHLTGAVACDQIVEGTHEAVASIGGHQQLLIVRSHQHLLDGGTWRWRQLTG